MLYTSLINRKNKTRIN